MSFFKKTFVGLLSLLLVIVSAAVLLPRTASAVTMSFGPFIAFGGTIKITEDVVGVTGLVYVIESPMDEEDVFVIAAGSVRVGFLVGGVLPVCPIKFKILGFGIGSGPYIKNIFSVCLPMPD